jgi:hypothetical protein
MKPTRSTVQLTALLVRPRQQEENSDIAREQYMVGIYILYMVLANRKMLKQSSFNLYYFKYRYYFFLLSLLEQLLFCLANPTPIFLFYCMYSTVQYAYVTLNVARRHFKQSVPSDPSRRDEVMFKKLDGV